MDFNQPLLRAGDILVSKLSIGYLVTPQDITRMNYVHLVCLTIIEQTPGESYQFYIKSAIEWLTIDRDFKHSEPYELWINAGYLDTSLNEIHEKPELDIDKFIG